MKKIDIVLIYKNLKLVRLYICFLSLIWVEYNSGQGSICFETDTNLCYFKEKYLVSNFAIEKQFESEEEIWVGDNTLLADMDGDCIPEFIIPAIKDKSILIIDSKTGITKWKINTPFIYFSPGSMAIADLDGDRLPEIFLKAGISSQYPSNVRGKLMCYNADGSVRWISY